MPAAGFSLGDVLAFQVIVRQNRTGASKTQVRVALPVACGGIGVVLALMAAFSCP
jgi:hypothetical protein